MKFWKVVFASLAAMGAQPLAAQMASVPDRSAQEGEGPFDKLLIRGATVIEGTGAPPAGPIDILVEGNRIAALYPGGAPKDEARTVQRVIDAKGMYVLPGFVDTHGHNGDPAKAPQPSYGYKLWLAHGVTTVRGVSFYFGPGKPDLSDARRSAANTIVAPRLIPYAVFGDKWSGGNPDTPAKAREWVRWAKTQGYWGIKFFNTATPAVLEAALDEAKRQQMGTVAHLAQTGVAEVNARKAVELGLDGATHFYGHFESLLKEGLPYYPEDYNYFDEQARFGWVARLAPQAVEPGS